MANFEVEQGEKQRSLWPFLLIGAAVVAALVILFAWTARRPAGPAPGVAAMPFGGAEQAYAGKVKFESLKMSRFANFLNQEVTYLNGEIVNEGDRTIGDLEVRVEFRNAQNQVVLRQTLRPLGERPVAIPPGARRSFQLGFEQIPDDWNMQYPSVQVTGIVLH